MEHVVETRYGRLRGTDRHGVRVFRAVPFARPPLGERRFREPEPPEPWAGVRDATAHAASAPQNGILLRFLPGIGVGRQHEDCLFLNVFAPSGPPARRPVLFWIHGGGFVIGAGSQPIYDGRALARRGDAVVVTINYRLGALGFLFLEECGGEALDAAANPGLLDQLAALRWVRENVEAFGGDPDNVTVFGESAGAMSIGALLGLPAARGLFRRGILQSGACQALHTAESATRVARAFLGALGLGPREAAPLREIPVARLLEAQGQVLTSSREPGVLLPFQPVVDGRTLPRHPLATLREGGAEDTALLVGTTRDEWRLFALADPKLRTLDESALLRRVERRVLAADPSRLVATYRAARDGRGAVDPPALFNAIETDRNFRIPALRLAEARAPTSAATFAYLFAWESPFFGGALGACHAIDLPFVFGALGLEGMDKLAGAGPEAQRLAERTMDAWLAFARDGDPSHAGLGAWPTYEASRRQTMVLGPECGVAADPAAAERRVWDGIL